MKIPPENVRKISTENIRVLINELGLTDDNCNMSYWKYLKVEIIFFELMRLILGENQPCII